MSAELGPDLNKYPMFRETHSFGRGSISASFHFVENVTNAQVEKRASRYSAILKVEIRKKCFE